MRNQPLNSETFFDVMHDAINQSSEVEILEKNIPVYFRKFNCFVSCVLKKKHNRYSEIYLLPNDFERSSAWCDIQKQIIELHQTKSSDSFEIQIDGRYYFGYPLVDYGILILGRKNPFHNILKSELIPMVEVLNKSLIQILEQQQLVESKKQLEDAILKQQKRIYGFTQATEKLLDHSNLADAIASSLSILGVTFNVGRTYLFENTVNSKSELVTSRGYEWTANGITSSQTLQYDLNNIPIAAFDHFMPNLSKKEPFESFVSQLDDDLFIKRILLLLDVKTVLLIPVFLQDKFWGIIGFDDCLKERKWQQEELVLLRSFANSLTSALEIADTANKLEDMALFALENPDPIVRINLKGDVLLKNLPSRILDQLTEKNNKEITEQKLYDNLISKINRTHRKEVFEITAGKEIYLTTARLSETNEYINIYFSNITQHKQNELKLKLQEEKYRNIISNMNLGLLEVDLEDNILFCNQSFENTLGFTFDELREKKAKEIFVTTNNYKIVDRKNTLKNSGIYDSYELLVRDKQGDHKWLLITGAPNYNDYGEITGSIGVYLDITKQKSLEKDLEKALQESRKTSEAKELFLANMSHEIRTPLNGIVGMLRELDKERLSLKQKAYLNSTMKASKHLSSIVNRILEITKIEAGELILLSQHFNFRELMDDVSSIFESEIKHKEITFKLVIDQNVSEVFVGDASIIRQVLINLVGNAIKFTEEGSVTVHCLGLKTVREEQELSIVIDDTGIGMDKDYLVNVFEKFQQEDPSTSRKYGGTGLGLFITKKLMDIMNGSLTLSSVKARGTKVQAILALPIGNISKLKNDDDVIEKGGLDNAKILLVEDDEINRIVVTNALIDFNVKITEAINGIEAIEILKKESFDLILMDVQMPVMGGIEATRYIRETLEIKIPIIALSANAFKSQIDNCITMGMNDYMTKPFDEQELLRLILKYYKLK